MAAQIERLVAGVAGVLKQDLVGAYLHGSAVLGGLRPHSDIDVIAVATRPTTHDEKRSLTALLLELSRRPRPIELDIVVESEIRPWRYPPAFDFHYSDLLRNEFEGGRLEPWSTRTSPDLASVVTIALLGGASLAGPPPSEVFDPVPREDFVRAILRDVDTIDEYLDWDTRNVVLTLPRIWSAIATDDVHSKDSAAAWALPQLPDEHRHVLERARAVYRGEAAEEPWDDVLPQVRAYADYVVSAIRQTVQLNGDM